MEALKKYYPSLYEQLEVLPEGLAGEIIDGEIHTIPRPTGKHGESTSVLGMDIGSAYHRGRGGPGGWWILDEPEVHFILDSEVCIPDLAGWQRERMPNIPDGHKFTIFPDWICEVFSPATKSKDREIKMPLYARHGVQYIWLVDPVAKSLEAYKLNNSQWQMLGIYRDDDKVCVEPFNAISINLIDLWS